MANFSFYVAMAILVVLLMLALSPTRAVVAYVFSEKGFLHPVLAAAAGILRAHLTVVRNFGPRSIIYPTLEPRKRTNQED